MNVILQLEKLSKYYLDGAGNELKIIRDLEARFPPNKSISIVGRSGSGKSTLLHLMGGLDHPTRGKVYFQEDDIYEYDVDKLSEWRNKNVGFIFQGHHLLPDFSALENVMIPGMIAGRTVAQCQQLAEELLEQVDLKDRLSHKPAQLSGGESQRVAIARAMINSPDIILADEPTGNLDNQTGDKVGLLLQQVCREQKTTLIIVTHNIQLASCMDYRYELSQGKLEIL